MKFLFSCLLLFVCCIPVFATAQLPADTTDKKSNKPMQNNLLIKVHSLNGLGVVKPAAARYNFGSMFGTGAEVMLGFKLNPTAAFAVGFARMQYFLNQSKVNQTLSDSYGLPWLSATVSSTKNSALIQNSLFIRLSRWRQQTKSIFEYYGNMGIGSFQYKLNSRVLQQSTSSAYNFTRTFAGGISNTAFILGAGIHYSYPLSKTIYLSSGAAYHYNLTPRTYLYEKNVYANGDEATYQVELPAPSHFLFVQVGLMYKPDKPCNCKNMGLDAIR